MRESGAELNFNGVTAFIVDHPRKKARAGIYLQGDREGYPTVLVQQDTETGETKIFIHDSKAKVYDTYNRPWEERKANDCVY